MESIKLLKKIIEETKDIKEKKIVELKNSPKLNKKILNYILYLKKLNEKFIVKITKDTGSKNIINECNKIIALLENVNKDLNTDMYFSKEIRGQEYWFPNDIAKDKVKKIYQIFDIILALENHIFVELESHSYLLDKYIPEKVLGRGNSSIGYTIKNHPELIMTINEPYDFKKEFFRFKSIMEATKKLPKNVSIGRIMDVGILDRKIIVIQTRASGNDLKSKNYLEWSKKRAILADVPQEHFNKLVRDAKIIISKGIMIDTSKPDNLFYGDGFTFIDLNISTQKKVSMCYPIIDTFSMTQYSKYLNDNDKKNIVAIIDKLKIAGDYLDNAFTDVIRSCITQ